MIRKACLFVDEMGGTPSEGFESAFQAYPIIRDWLATYVGKFEVEHGVQLFQLRYKIFDVCIIDVGGYPPTRQKEYMSELKDIILDNPNSTFLFWTGETWEAMERVFFVTPSNCVNCCDCDLTTLGG